jgi:hypothetical protein
MNRDQSKAQKLINGWAAFGIARRFDFAGAGTLAFGQHDTALKLIDSAAARARFWKRCLSLHRCADQNAIIFTFREPVADQGGRAGFCAIATALSLDALQEAPAIRQALITSNYTLLQELYQRGTGDDRRFFMDAGRLRKFVQERSAVLAPQGFASKETIVPDNERRRSYWVDGATWEQLSYYNWLAFPFADLEANLFFFGADKDPRLAELHHLSIAELEQLAQKAQAQLGDGTRVKTRKSSKTAKAKFFPIKLLSPARDDTPQPERDEDAQAAHTDDSVPAQEEATEISSKPSIAPMLREKLAELNAYHEAIVRLTDAAQKLDDRVTATIAAVEAELGIEEPAHEHAYRSRPQELPVHWSQHARPVPRDPQFKVFGILAIPILLLLFVILAAKFSPPHPLKDQAAPVATGCTITNLRTGIKGTILRLTAKAAALTPGETAELDRKLDCAAALASKFPQECRMTERTGGAIAALRDASLFETARTKLRSALLDMISALDNCKGAPR